MDDTEKEWDELIIRHQLTKSVKMLKFAVGTFDRLTASETLQKEYLQESSDDTELLDVLGLQRVCVAGFLNFRKQFTS